MNNEEQNKDKYFYVVTETIASHHTIILDVDIEEPDKYRDLILLLDNCRDNDTIDFHISSDGGLIKTVTAIASAMIRCKAHITGYIAASCQSGGTLLAMYCDDWVIGEEVYWMAHTLSDKVFGSIEKMHCEIQGVKKYTDTFIRNAYKDFYSESEIDRILDGKDSYLIAEELRVRFDKLKESRSK